METLANLESFVRSAEAGSFSEAARRLALTPSAVSRNVAMLERNLGVRLFQRSTRRLTLTEAGERFLLAIGGNMDALQAAIASVASDQGAPSGVLKVSMAPAFGMAYVMPLLPEFLQRYPGIRPEWHFENRTADLIAEGFDAAIGGGFELSPGMVSRVLTPAHIVAVASPAYLRGRPAITHPSMLEAADGIAMRSGLTGRIRRWAMRNDAGEEIGAALPERIVVNDPLAMREAALLGLGITFLALMDVLPWLQRGELVRVAPQWHAYAGDISIYYPTRKLLPAKTRVFVDYVVDAFRRDGLTQRLAAGLAG
jgi:DNA-binding transcriptional LysR family regulator